MDKAKKKGKKKKFTLVKMKKKRRKQNKLQKEWEDHSREEFKKKMGKKTM